MNNLTIWNRVTSRLSTRRMLSAAICVGCAGVVIRCLQFVSEIEIPSAIAVVCFGLAGMMALCADRFKKVSVNAFLMTFTVVSAISILCNKPDPAFQSWNRLAAFAVALCCLSPLLTSGSLEILRKMMWRALMWSLRIIVIASAIQFIYIIATEGSASSSLFAFSGFTSLGMVLSPVCAIVAIDSLWRLLDCKPKKCLILWGILEVVAVALMVCAGSRIAVAGYVIAAITLLWFCRATVAKRWKPLAVVAVCTAGILASGWSLLGSAIIIKNRIGITQGSVIHSRTERWSLRWDEFKENPLIGVGFDVIPHDSVEFNNPDSPDYRTPWESGSSWLGVLSMTGIAGAICIAGFIIQFIIRLFKNRSRMALHLALFIFLIVNGTAEGWLTYAGGLTFLIFWLLTGTIAASTFEKGVPTKQN